MTDSDRIRRLVEEMSDAFTSRGVTMLLHDGLEHQCIVAEEGSSLRGVIVWAEFGAEVELLWMAVDRGSRNRGIGTILLKSVEDRTTNQRVVFLKTADPGNLPPRSGLTKSNFEATIRFFVHRGFDIAAKIPDFWGGANHAVVLVKRLWVDDE